MAIRCIFISLLALFLFNCPGGNTIDPGLGGKCKPKWYKKAKSDSDIVYAWADVHVTSATAMTAISEIRSDAHGSVSVTAATNLSSKDITADIAVALNVDWSVANADNEVRIDAFSVELV